MLSGLMLTVAVALSLPCYGANRSVAVAPALHGFDEHVERVLRDWNGVGVGVGVVVGDRLVFARGYGYRDYEKKLPVTPRTLFQIASNTKLFTAVAAGLLVEEGRLTWDGPLRESVPSLRFHSEALDSTVTLRDLLAHRTGITRHDSVWYGSGITAREIYERLRFLAPTAPLRQVHLYNNLTYSSVGHIVELESGRPWKQFVKERILSPLDMKSTVFSVADMVAQSDHGVPYDERRDTAELYRIPYYEDTDGIAAAGSMISNIEDLSHWLAALMNAGTYAGKQVLPANVLAATLQPSIAVPNELGDTYGWWELQNPVEGMGRRTASYRGHLITYHGGALPGFYSQLSYLPNERIGVIVFTIGKHTRKLTDALSYEVYERLLGMSRTPWTERWLDVQRREKLAATVARAKAGSGRVHGKPPSHALSEYVGAYEHPAYGLLSIGLDDGRLRFDFHDIRLPLAHFHYDRFDTPDDEQHGLWSVNFATNPQGDIERATVSLDEAEATFVRRAPPIGRAVFERLAGSYESRSGARSQVIVRPDGQLVVVSQDDPPRTLVPYRDLRFRIREFSDVTYEFVMDGERVVAFRKIDPSGEYLSTRVAGR